jgi:secreted trypsin-like serine protease
LFLIIDDSGSPIFQWAENRWQQVGIASSPKSYVESRTCGIYTRLVSYYNWIQSIINTCSISSTTTTTTAITTPTTTTPFKASIIYQCNKTSSCGCGAIPVVLTPTRIVGGENAIDYSWPMVVSIRWLDVNQHWCGGTIVSNSYILTAAHCLVGYISNPPIDVTIAAGVTNREDPRQIRRSVDQIFIYPNYTGVKDGYRHDIALMHVNKSFTVDENPFLTKTCIHRVDPPILNNQYIKNGTDLVVIGWGTNKFGATYSPEILQQAEVYAIDNEHPACAASMNDSETQFCAGLLEGGKGECIIDCI